MDDAGMVIVALPVFATDKISFALTVIIDVPEIGPFAAEFTEEV